MELRTLLLMPVLLPFALSGYTQARPKVEVTVMPSDDVFSGETVTLRCDLEEGVDWTYGWYKDDSVVPISTERVYKFISDESDAGKYTCRGEKKQDTRRSEISDAVTLTVSDFPRATITADPDLFVFTGETIALKCAIESHYSDWRFHWSTYSSMFAAGEKNTSTETLTIESVSESDQDRYWCWGERESRPMQSQKSEAVSVNVADRAQAVLEISQNWLTEGDSVTLVCAVRSSSRGWTFNWYRDDHELSSESSKGDEGSYTLSPAAVKHTGVYACRAERGAYYTEYSYTQLLWVTPRWPAASLIISPSRSQHFLSDSLSLSCEDQMSSRWSLRRYGESLEDCSSSDWGSITGSTCRISSLKTTDTGVYWCQSESREKSQPVNITVHDVDVILESSVYPVNEEHPLTLRCLQRTTNSSNLRAVFYKDRSLIHTQITDNQISIPAVSKSHEGFYYCKFPERGESPKSWVSVTESQTEYQISALKMISSVFAVSPYVLVSIILGVKFHRANGKPDEVHTEYVNWRTRQQV